MRHDIFTKDDLPTVDPLRYEVDVYNQRLVVGATIGKAVIPAVVPITRQFQDEAVRAENPLVEAVVKVGEPEFFRDAKTNALGMNLSASLVAVIGLRLRQDALHNPAEETEEYRDTSTGLSVLRSGTRRLYEELTGSSVSAVTDPSSLRLKEILDPIGVEVPIAPLQKAHSLKPSAIFLRAGRFLSGVIRPPQA